MFLIASIQQEAVFAHEGERAQFAPQDREFLEPDDPSAESQLPASTVTRLRLPDLVTLPPSNLTIEISPYGERELRLSNTIWNRGSGPLELEGATNPETRQTRVVQHIQAQVGTSLDHHVGEFIWHPTHDHWHFEDFSLYELWSLTPNGRLASVVRSSGKLSYCVIDTDSIDPDNPGYQARRSYFGCGQKLQGLSAGWGDTYKSFLDGQSLHLNGIGDGYYALVSTANPNAILMEADYSNNAAILYLKIWGEHLEMLTLEEMIERRCNETDVC